VKVKCLGLKPKCSLSSNKNLSSNHIVEDTVDISSLSDNTERGGEEPPSDLTDPFGDFVPIGRQALPRDMNDGGGDGGRSGAVSLAECPCFTSETFANGGLSRMMHSNYSLYVI